MIINANCLDWMRTQPDDSIDCVVTDPPYGLAFMGKKWDYQLPSIEIWQEALRICKPGAWLLAFGGSRTYHRLTCSIEDAGWVIRDCIMWMHGQGFPKGKGCLKPAYEPIILAIKRAPKPELNIDECRITTSENLGRKKGEQLNCYGKFNPITIETNYLGRWPANVILDEEAAEMLDQQSGILKSGSGDKHSKTQHKSFSGRLNPISGLREYKADSGGASRFFYCAKASSRERNRGCEALKSRESKRMGSIGSCENQKPNPQKEIIEKNNHPTVKPLKLMEYLIKLVAPKDGVILDPFCGSGTTLVAAKKLCYKAIGVELDPEYCKIAEARIAAQECQLEMDI